METKPLRVLSLFDGISCARVALGNRPVAWYGASEIDINAIAVSFDNHSDITPLGDVCDVSGVRDIDLLIAGSPCTDLSIAKKDRQGLKGDHSKLFYEFLRILRETKPRYFILENVASMKKEDRDEITKLVGVAPIMIDAALVSAQSRKRYFWTNIAVKGLPEDRNIKLKDILEQNVGEEFYTKSTAKRVMKAVKTGDEKANCLLATSWKGAGANGMTNITTIKKENEAFNQIGYIGSKNACGVGGQALRIYDTDKKAPTSGVGLYAIGHLGDTNSQANRIYDTEGKACTLSANGGGLGAKTGLYQVGTSIRAHKIGEEWVNKIEYRNDNKVSALTTTFAGKLALVTEFCEIIGDTAKVREATTQGYAIAKEGDAIDVSFPNSKTRRGRVGEKAKNLMTSSTISVLTNSRIRKLTPIECERLQSLPDGYTKCLSKTQRYRCLGNAFNVEVIKFILSFLQ